MQSLCIIRAVDYRSGRHRKSERVEGGRSCGEATSRRKEGREGVSSRILREELEEEDFELPRCGRDEFLYDSLHYRHRTVAASSRNVEHSCFISATCIGYHKTTHSHQ